MDDFQAEPVPPWATEQVGDPKDFESIAFSIEFTADTVALTPDAFNWWLTHELEDLRKHIVDEYYGQRGSDG